MDTIWTQERCDLLRTFAAEGMTGGKIAAELGVTRSAVMGKCRRLGIKLGEGRENKQDPAARPRAQRKHPFRITPKIVQAIPEPEPSSTEACDIFGLRAGICHYPLWGENVSFSEQLYCGAKAKKGHAYCARHHALCSVPIARYHQRAA